MTMLEAVEFSEFEVILLSAGALLGVVVSLVACACCFGKNFGFKEFSDNQSVSGTDDSHGQSDFNVFDPRSAHRQTSDESIKFDPLPHPSTLLPTDVATLRPRIVPLNKERLGTEALLESFNYEFSRDQLQFVKEIGSGWFGKVLQGEAQKITVGLKKSKVVVKMLDMEASEQDKVDFLLDNLSYRELDHANVVRLLGQCTQSMPFLIIMEYFALGDVKSYLLQRQNEVNALNERRTLVKFACNMAAGLHCLHFHHFVHNDFALRNCMVAMDLSVKVGDYGIAEDLYKDDYYGPEGYEVPIRWSAPETAQVSGGNIVVKNITKEANVWTFGVVLWELVALGDQPYKGMTDIDVIEKVLVKQEIKPSVPRTPIKDKERMYEIMQLCMGEPSLRPSMAETHRLLQHLLDSPFELDDFDKKWNQLLPKRDSVAEEFQAHGAANFPVKFDDENAHDFDDISAPIGGSRMSFTKGVDGKPGLDTNEESSGKMIVNPSFEDDDDDNLADFMDETLVPDSSESVAVDVSEVNDVVIDLPVELDKGETKLEMNGKQQDLRVEHGADISIAIADAEASTETGGIPSEDDAHNVHSDIRGFELSRDGSFLTATSSMSTSPKVVSSTSDDFVTPVGSVESDMFLQSERSEDEIVLPMRERFFSGSESERDISSHTGQTEKTLLHNGESASERVSKVLSEIEPPPYTPGKSPGLQEESFDFEKGPDKDSDHDDAEDSENVVVRRKKQREISPSQRSGLIESEVEIDSPSNFMNLKINIDANAHVHHEGEEKTRGDAAAADDDYDESKEPVLTGSDSKTYRRKSSIKDQNLALVGNKRVSFTDVDSLVQVHTYPKDGTTGDQDGGQK